MGQDFSKEALKNFIDYIIDKGLINVETGKSWRVATSKLLADLSEVEEADVRTIDVDVAAHRYANRNGGSLTPTSLNTYRTRVTSAIQEFVRYVENPMGYKPRSLNGKHRKNEPKNRASQDLQDSISDTSVTSIKPVPAVSSGLSMLYPIRQDFLAQVVIPRDLTLEEAKRLGAFLLTLAFDFKPGGE